jgi:hypothetical protein
MMEKKVRLSAVRHEPQDKRRNKHAPGSYDDGRSVNIGGTTRTNAFFYRSSER